MFFRVIWDSSEAIAGLANIRAAAKDLRPVWPSLLTHLREASTELFASAGARSGVPWPELTANYEAWKAVEFPGKPILRASDEMFKSLTEKTEDSVEQQDPLELLYGTRNIKADWHHRGAGRLPVRKVVTVTEADRRIVQRLVREHLNNQLALSGFIKT